MLARVRFIRPYLLWRTGEEVEMIEEEAIRLSVGGGPEDQPVVEFVDDPVPAQPATQDLPDESSEPAEIEGPSVQADENTPQVSFKRRK